MCYAMSGAHRTCGVGCNVAVLEKTLLLESIDNTPFAYGTVAGHYQLLAFAVMWRG
jgi:hypothetical protein